MAESITENVIIETLNDVYSQALSGIPKVNKPIKELANDYINSFDSVEKALNSLVEYQIIKCGTSGFVTGLGGLLTLPVSIPINIGTVWFVQLRMIAAIAYIGGYDINSDQVKTLSYVCLTGVAAADILKDVGIKIGEKLTTQMINKIPGHTIVAINKAVSFRFITKAGSKGIINLKKIVPILGGVIGGTIDATATRVIANNAINIFIKNKLPG